ncbi:MAG: SH3 domain-containing protein [Trichocoleus desertorum ATA4-8-CV12]|nr:SH3 domain-containing protein [Trichocoleus desertorum ATA4-8-CV12]
MEFLLQRWAIAGLSLATVVGAISAANPSHAMPSGLKPIPENACQRSSFYQVKTSDGLGLVARRSDGSLRSLANGTLIKFLGEGRRGASLLVTGEKAPVVVDNLQFRSLVKIASSGRFAGKMRIKTLEPGGYVNLRKEATVWGGSETLVAGVLKDGTKVSVKGLAPNTSEFYYVMAPGGLEGYVTSSYLLCNAT